MNNEINIQTEQQLIEVIGAHIINQLGQQKRILEIGDIQIFHHMSNQLQTFLFQSELAYQCVFSSVGSFLDSVRTLFLQRPFYDYKDDALIKHDEFVIKVQSLIKEALNTFHAHVSQQVNEEISDYQFFNLSVYLKEAV